MKSNRRPFPAWPLPTPLSLLLLLLLSGCMIGTAFRLLQSRGHFLKFDKHFQFHPATEERGPVLEFLDPLLTLEDIETIANGRAPSVLDSVGMEQRWIYRWQRQPSFLEHPVSLELRFRDERLSSLSLDRRFSEVLGDERIEMLLRSFTSRITDLDLGERVIRCEVPADSLAGFSILDNADIHACFGRSNYFRSSDMPGARRQVFRYRLEGTEGKKGRMSFSAHVDRHDQRALAISAKIGSFRLVLDLSAGGAHSRTTIREADHDD